MKKQLNKPFIETLINTSALALTSYGVLRITEQDWTGYISLSFGMGLEMLKYWGRNKNYW